jgi:uncharacterized protein YbjT (DUF2867 family)
MLRDHPTPVHVLVLGGNGTLGRLVRDELAARGHHPVAQRRGEPIGDAPLIINCAGASVQMALGHGWRGYGAVDVPVGLAAVEAARRNGARLVYVAAHHKQELRKSAYVAAHERVAAAMRDLGDTGGCVVRATGFYSAFGALLAMARRGWLADVGDGRARTNPIDERDLATIVVDAAFGDAREVAAGGPEILTRGELFEQIAAAAGRRVRMVRVPVWLARAGSAFARILHPRIGQFAQFATLLARHDSIAPALGQRRLADYLTSA